MGKRDNISSSGSPSVAVQAQKGAWTHTNNKHSEFGCKVFIDERITGYTRATAPVTATKPVSNHTLQACRVSLLYLFITNIKTQNKIAQEENPTEQWAKVITLMSWLTKMANLKPVLQLRLLPSKVLGVD